jgi:HAD superfamily hydrolase (TIGR01484 family)
LQHKILVFDLDGTLCQLGKGMHPEDAALLRQLEEKGHTIVVCSGKTTYYLCGFLRQVGLKDPIMVGENGGAVQFGISLPPDRFEKYPVAQEQKRILEMLRKEIDAACGNRVWYQPNEVQLTPFPRDEGAYSAIRAILQAHSEELREIQVYEQNDCFDIVPSGINKQNGLRLLSRMLEADPSRFLVVGDGVNDLPMFQFGDFSILIRPEGKETGLPETDIDLVLPDIRKALEYIWEKERKETQSIS